MTASTFAELDAARRKAVPAPRRVAREFILYFGCSLLALAADFGLYATGIRMGINYPLAAAIGFSAGLWLAYTLSVRYVFIKRRLSSEGAEFMVFAGIGLLGLLLTEALLWLMVGRGGIGPLPAKVAAAGIVFGFNFGARKALLFSASKERVHT